MDQRQAVDCYSYALAPHDLNKQTKNKQQRSLIKLKKPLIGSTGEHHSDHVLHLFVCVCVFFLNLRQNVSSESDSSSF